MGKSNKKKDREEEKKDGEDEKMDDEEKKRKLLKEKSDHYHALGHTLLTLQGEEGALHQTEANKRLANLQYELDNLRDTIKDRSLALTNQINLLKKEADCIKLAGVKNRQKALRKEIIAARNELKELRGGEPDQKKHAADAAE
jgi:hypothetical protein